jgi:GH43 family beta-xylosidase
LQNAEETVVWRAHDSGDMSQHIWAPELHLIAGVWYLYFAASRKDDIWALRPYVLRCTGSDPMQDSWEECGMLTPADEFSFQDFSL